jgi:hypothetical protein
VRIARGFETCLVNCASDADCRGPDYVCSSYHACVPKDGFYLGSEVKPGTNNGAACVEPVVSPSADVLGPNRRISASDGELGAEVELAIDPVYHQVVASWIDLSSDAAGLRVATSIDDGQTFGPPTRLPMDKSVDMDATQSDPVVAFDSHGTAYIVWIGFDRTATAQGTTHMHVWVARKKWGELGFGAIFEANPSATTNFAIDKPWIAVGPDDSVFVTWSQAGKDTPQVIYVARSIDGGTSFSDPVPLSDDGEQFVTTNLAMVNVGTDGTPYVVWTEVNDPLGDPANQIRLQRLKADGTRDGANVIVTAQGDSPAFDDPSVVATGNTVYVGFVSGDFRGAWDVRVAASLDRGGTFQPSVKVNDDPSCATHFHHALALDGGGTLHAAWYDNRYLVGNVFHATSGQAQVTAPLAFGPNRFVNDTSFPFTAERDTVGWLGDYLGMVASGSTVYVVWTDPRNKGDSQIYFARSP